MAAAAVASAIAANKVLIFSKTYCPYCVNAKAAFKGIGVTPMVIELDNDRTGIQAELGKLTGATSVPRVFIDGKFLGGGDDTVAAAQSGKLAQLCKAAGVL